MRCLCMKEGCALILKQSKLDMISSYLGLKKLKVKEQIPMLSQDAKAKHFMKEYILSAHAKCCIAQAAENVQEVP